MKTNRLLVAGMMLALAACEGWPVRSSYYNPSTPPPSRTPGIQTPTPRILSPVPGSATAASSTPATETATVTATEAAPTDTLTPLPTALPTSVQVEVLGCATSIDLSHGMGEVTDAYVTISNPTAADVSNVCATLRGLDEGRPHPDKTKCLPTLPAGNQVTLKLTVDTTYKAESPIQVDVNSGDTLLVRAGQPSCREIGIFMPKVEDLGVIKPIK